MARRLAASVVLTLSVAELAVAGCAKPMGNPPPLNPPPPDDGGADGNGDPEGEPDSEPIPPDDGTQPEADGDGTAEPTNEGSAKTTIQQREDGTCVEIVSVDCPPNVMCNPPPPREVPCPKDQPSGA